MMLVEPIRREGRTVASFVLGGLCCLAEPAEAVHGRVDKLFSMSLSQLMEVRVSNLGSLTKTSLRKSPAASTRVTAEQIEMSGARSLQELLDIYVPGVQWARHHWEFSHLGSRGIISDREDKVMIRVNGRVMNERTHAGAVTERNLPMLGDIERIDVIRGPGSSLYGLGAVSMVVDIHTHTAKTLSKSSLTVKGGAGHVFQSVEGRFIKTLGDGTGLSMYIGLANVEGADDADAPWKLGVDACPKPNPNAGACTVVNRGHSFPVGVKDGMQFGGRAPVKLHFEMTREDTDFWLRYTRAGEVEPAEVFFAVAPPVGFGNQPMSMTEHGYEQFTAFLEHRHHFSPDLELTGAVSFDTTELIRRRLHGPLPDHNHREREWQGKVALDWDPGERFEVVVGAEYAHEKFGLGGSHLGRAVSARLGAAKPWTTSTISVFGGWQYRMTDTFTTFIDARLDRNRYSASLFSPRMSLVWAPDEVSTWKLMATRSQRMNFAEENRAAALGGTTTSRPETLDTVELRYEHVRPNLHWGLSAFVLELDAIGWDDAVGVARSVLIAKQRQWGLEFEWKKLFKRASISLSHAYTKLLDFDPQGQQSLISVPPYEALNNWSNHITKLQLDFRPNPKLTLNTSLRVYWGFPGLQDRYDQQQLSGFGSRFISPGWRRGAQEQVYLNAGAIWKFSDTIKASLHLYNLLGLVNEDFNKRIYFGSLSDYRAEAPAAALSVSAEF